MTIPMIDLQQQYAAIKAQLDERLINCLGSAHFILGPEVKALEKEIATYLGCEHSIGLASGTDALILALRAANIKAGDEVITSPFTFMATGGAIALVGATPVFVDIDPRTFNIDPDAIRRAITPATRAIIAVHLFGQSADMTTITAIAKEHQLTLIEDAAQSIGATWKNKQTGSFGDFGCFSFYPTKNLGCYGDGGLISTNRQDYAEKISMLRNHGSKIRYHHDILGYNSRLDEMQAIILRTKFPHLDSYNAGRRQVAEWYNHYLSQLPITLPYTHPDAYHVYHQYTILSDKRDDISKKLSDAGIANMIYYPIPLHRQALFGDRYHAISLPVSEHVAAQCLSLPIFPEMTEAQVQQVAMVMAEALRV